MKKYFRATYAVVSYASAEDGDFEDSGTIESMDFNCMPDEYDIEEGLTSADLAIKQLKDLGAVYSSNSSFHPSTWYMTEGERDYRTGDVTEYCFHPYGFSDSELELIFNGITAKDNRR